MNINLELFDSPRSFPEDHKDENGSYMCKCMSCGELFIGYKRRVMCKLCTQKAIDGKSLKKGTKRT